MECDESAEGHRQSLVLHRRFVGSDQQAIEMLDLDPGGNMKAIRQHSTLALHLTYGLP